MPHYQYFDTWKTDDHYCESCQWIGPGQALEEGEVTDDLFELCCPCCGKCVSLVMHPTVEESRAHWSELSPMHRESIERIDRLQQDFERRKLTSMSQLLDIPARSFSLAWDQSGKQTLI